MPVENKPICLTCNEPVSDCKEYYIKRHHISKHSSEYDKYQSECRQEKVKEFLESSSWTTIGFFKTFFKAEVNCKSELFGGRNNCKKSKPFSDREFVKEWIVWVADVLCPKKKETFAKISLSRQIFASRVKELAYSMEESLTAKAQTLLLYSLALIFMRGVDDNFEITEELASIIPLKGIIRGIDLLKGVMATIKRLGLSLSNFLGITTYDVPSMAGRQQDPETLLQCEASKDGNDSTM